MVEQTLFGHWQIECHAILYEIKARGSFWTKKLEAVPSPKNKSRRKVYYRKKIGEIRYSAKETGERVYDLVPDATYNLLFRNCQTSSMRPAEHIIVQREIPDLDWPVSSIQLVTLVLGLTAVISHLPYM
ncbi:hypothetical protein N0V91_005189 [Didymella pomorum]|uniref:Uncharacterized protein n=1 Tax=Didymella pomorum TaxID=749634 RepID=A0A9W9D7E5_9PLEO|nr:hypothetical protein N0V91_005189 [Didymella pomorum]